MLEIWLPSPPQSEPSTTTDTNTPSQHTHICTHTRSRLHFYSSPSFFAEHLHSKGYIIMPRLTLYSKIVITTSIIAICITNVSITSPASQHSPFSHVTCWRRSTTGANHTTTCPQHRTIANHWPATHSRGDLTKPSKFSSRLNKDELDIFSIHTLCFC